MPAIPAATPKHTPIANNSATTMYLPVIGFQAPVVDDYFACMIRKNSSDSSAQRGHWKSRARVRPAVARLARSEGDSRRRVRVTSISETLFGSINAAASAVTSGKQLVFDVMTGVPAAMAWTTGNPNPSYRDG